MPLNTANVKDLLPTDPPEPKPHPEITRGDYDYQTPAERAAVVNEVLIGIDEIESSLTWLNRADPETGENFPGGKEALETLRELVKEHRVKVEGWL